MSALAQGGGPPILLTGGTGYVGRRLLERLEQGHPGVRCLTRRPDALRLRRLNGWELVVGDLLVPATLGPAMRGIDTAYYLVHSMGAPGEFAELDRRAAGNFAAAARACGLRHIIYLSGLGSGGDLSEHLSSRHEVGDILRASGVVTTELRASIVIGAGSASFEAVRAVVEQLPAIPRPSVLDTAAQPIAIDDLIDYLLAALTVPRHNAIYEIGGQDRVTYAELMSEYARQRHLHRRLVAVPAPTLRAAPTLLKLLSPEHGRVVATMMESLGTETVIRAGGAHDAFGVTPRGLSEAIGRAIASEDRQFADTSWGEVLAPAESPRWGGIRVRRRRVSSRVARIHAHPAVVWGHIERLGGARGWCGAGTDWFWRVRGALDALRGGDGMRRGRRDPLDVRVGDSIDFWRVERVDRGRRLLLAAEMRLPGRLWLQFEVRAAGGGTELRQTTVFDPAGYAGALYWHVLYPVHSAVFRSLLRGLRRETEAPHELARAAGRLQPDGRSDSGSG